MRRYEPIIRFLERLVGHDGDACIRWPYSCDTSGYGQVPINRTICRAHRVMCELAHGPAPTNQHEAAHSCGDSICVNPNHLSWKTTTENKLDTVAHGNGKQKGAPRRKLTDEQVAEIRSLKATQTYRQIAARYGVNYRTVGLIATGRERPDRPKRHRGRPYRPDEKARMAEKARELHAAGKSWRHIAEAVGCSRYIVKELVAEKQSA